MKMNAYTNAHIFTGDTFISEYCVLVEDGAIKQIIHEKNLPDNIPTYDCGEKFLVPAFIDLQVYGASGKLFSEIPTIESLLALYDYNKNSGTANCLVAIPTLPIENIFTCIDAIKKYWSKGGKGILGMHLEGPFINIEKKGAHAQECIHTPDVSEVTALLKKSDGVIKMVTLAPEILNKNIIQLFLDHNVKVSIGHSSATYEQAIDAINAGATEITHLFNAMSPLHHRAPGIIGAAFINKNVNASIIADGIHVHYEAIKIAKHMMRDRLFLITDAVTTSNKTPYQHHFKNDHYEMENGTLSGSALTMIKAVKNIMDNCDISLEEALRMASLYPAKVLGIENKFGRIEQGYEAHFTLIDKNLIAATAID